MARLVSYIEVEKHRTKDDLWVVLHGKVYDLSKFIHEHPGGVQVILKEAGRDATETFQMFHPKDILERLLPATAYVGDIDPSSKPTLAPLNAVPHASADGEEDDNENVVVVKKKKKNEVWKKPPVSALLNAFDFEAVARKTLKPEAWAYYSSGADDEITLRENHSAFHRIWWRPRVMVNVKHVSTATTMLNTPVTLPIYITACALGKLGHPLGEINLTLGAGTRGIVQMMPTLASCSLDEMMDAAIKPSPSGANGKAWWEGGKGGQVQWFQLYVNEDRKVTEKIVRHAESRGCGGLFVTVDAPQLGRREKDMRIKFVDTPPDVQQQTSSSSKPPPGGPIDRSQGAARAISSFIDTTLSWVDIPWFLTITTLPLCLKGIQRAQDAIRAIRMGCDGIVVSNHGGRQMDTVVSGVEALTEVVAGLKGMEGVKRVSGGWEVDEGVLEDGVREMVFGRIAKRGGAVKVVNGKRIHRFEIYVDGGIRRASDVLKCVALGATGCGMGRPFLYAMSGYGQEGVERLLDILRDEMIMDLRLLGCNSIADITEDLVRVGFGAGGGGRDYLTEGVYEPLRPVVRARSRL
ncbi:hypothetical protein HDU97_000378 [Phlyctochytrium planicorne]|nr:hypothetical protein HDU97_000378 [Phlyctochytrium planicorne]